MANVCYRVLKERGTSAWIKCIRLTFKHSLMLYLITKKVQEASGKVKFKLDKGVICELIE